MSASEILNVAVVGCGEVAVTVHLPYLQQCTHMYRIVALCDVSPQSVSHCANKYKIKATYTDISEMLVGSPEIDVVFILNANEYHVRHTVQSLEAGKHVLIEKPMSLTSDGADQIETARVKSGKVVFVGYMRRYSPAFLLVKDLVRSLPAGSIHYVRVRDLIGQNNFFVDQSGTFPQKFTDVPVEIVTERRELSLQMNEVALGPKAGNKLDEFTWMLLNGLSTHDISAMREIIGMPKRVLKATRCNNGLFSFVLFDYGTFVAYYETGIDNVRKFDAHIEVYAGDRHIKVTYDTPYVKGLPVTASILSSNPNGEALEEIIRPTYEDTYTAEYRSLYDAIVKGAEVKTGPLDAKQDTLIFEMIMEAMEDLQGC